MTLLLLKLKIIYLFQKSRRRPWTSIGRHLPNLGLKPFQHRCFSRGFCWSSRDARCTSCRAPSPSRRCSPSPPSTTFSTRWNWKNRSRPVWSGRRWQRLPSWSLRFSWVSKPCQCCSQARNLMIMLVSGIFRSRVMHYRQNQLHTSFLLYLALDVTPNCICEIHCIALDGFDLNSVHQLSIKEKNLGWAGIWTRGCWVGSKNATSKLERPWFEYPTNSHS